MLTEFETYAAGVVGAVKFNLAILKGENPVGISKDGDKIVRAQQRGAPEIIGSRILSNSIGEGKAAINSEQGDGVEIYYGPNHTRGHMTWQPTVDSETNIREAIPQTVVANKIIEELTHVQNAYGDGEMGRFDVYKVDDPAQADGGSYVRVKSMATNTPSGRMTRLKIDSFDSLGNKTSLNVGNDEVQANALVRVTGATPGPTPGANGPATT